MKFISLSLLLIIITTFAHADTELLAPAGLGEIIQPSRILSDEQSELYCEAINLLWEKGGIDKNGPLNNTAQEALRKIVDVHQYIRDKTSGFNPTKNVWYKILYSYTYTVQGNPEIYSELILLCLEKSKIKTQGPFNGQAQKELLNIVQIQEFLSNNNVNYILDNFMAFYIVLYAHTYSILGNQDLVIEAIQMFAKSMFNSGKEQLLAEVFEENDFFRLYMLASVFSRESVIDAIKNSGEGQSYLKYFTKRMHPKFDIFMVYNDGFEIFIKNMDKSIIKSVYHLEEYGFYDMAIKRAENLIDFISSIVVADPFNSDYLKKQMYSHISYKNLMIRKYKGNYLFENDPLEQSL